jgi:bacterioferritin
MMARRAHNAPEDCSSDRSTRAYEGGAVKGNEKVIADLNSRLAEELTAISQYMVHAELCEDWGYGKLHESIEKRAMDEMKHAETLIGRILFLEGKPIVSRLNPLQIGGDVKAILKNDLGAELDADKAYNASIKLAGEHSDFGTRQVLVGILKDEEEHIDTLESQLGQIQQMGIEDFLAAQIA